MYTLLFRPHGFNATVSSRSHVYPKNQLLLTWKEIIINFHYYTWRLFIRNLGIIPTPLGSATPQSLTNCQAIHEAINTARENKHDSSLLFSLAWLHEFAKSPNVRSTTKVSMSREESLQYLKMKTKEANIPSLLGTVNLMEASQLIQNVHVTYKTETLTVQGGNLAAVFGDLLQASYINMVYHILQAIGRQMLFQAGLWTYLGFHFSQAR